MRGGHNKRPAEQHVLRGTFRPDRHGRRPDPARKQGRLPKAPTGLSTAARGWWRRLLGDYELDDQAGLLLLESALRQFDRAEKARAILDKEGIVVTDRFGQQRAHPAAPLERDARAGMLAVFRALGIESGGES